MDLIETNETQAIAEFAYKQAEEQLCKVANWKAKDFNALYKISEASQCPGDAELAWSEMAELWNDSPLAEEFPNLHMALPHYGELTIQEFVAEVFNIEIEQNPDPIYDSPCKYLQSLAERNIEQGSLLTHQAFYADLEAYYWQTVEHNGNDSVFGLPQESLTLVQEAARTDRNVITEIERAQAIDTTHLCKVANWKSIDFYALYKITETSQYEDDAELAWDTIASEWEDRPIVDECPGVNDALIYYGELTIKELVSKAFSVAIEQNPDPIYESPCKYLQAVAQRNVEREYMPSYRAFYAELETYWHSLEDDSIFNLPKESLTLAQEAARTDINAMKEEAALLQPITPGLRQLWEGLKQSGDMQAKGQVEIEGSAYKIKATQGEMSITRTEAQKEILALFSFPKPEQVVNWKAGESPRLNSAVDQTELEALAIKIQAAAQAIATPSRPAPTKAAGIEI